MEETNDIMMMTSHMTCVQNLYVTMALAVVVTYILTNVGAKFDENRAKIASAVRNLFYTWKKPMIT